MKNRSRWILIAMALVFAVSVLGAGAMATQGHPQEMCPVMGGPINKDIHVDYEGKRIYFCCPACPKMFKENPQKYMKKMEQEGVELETAPSGS